MTVSVQMPVGTLNTRALADDPTGQAVGHVSTSVDFVGLVIDANDDVDESDENNNTNRGKGIDLDDVTYFPWDLDGDGEVTPVDAIFVINRLGQTVPPDARADFDGDGTVTTMDAIAAINRLGYLINPDVTEPSPAPQAESTDRTAAAPLPRIVDFLFDESHRVARRPTASFDDHDTVAEIVSTRRRNGTRTRLATDTTVLEPRTEAARTSRNNPLDAPRANEEPDDFWDVAATELFDDDLGW
jgi:hypothetical protein